MVDYWLSVRVTCARCRRPVEGRIGLSDRNQIVDSEGFVVFKDPGPVCDACMKEPDHARQH
jgi:hypothetical protein